MKLKNKKVKEMITLTNSGDEIIIDEIDEDLLCHTWSSDKWRGYTYITTTMILVKGRKKQKIRLHRLIAERILGRKLLTDEVVDHINHNGTDNRRSNLRIVDNKKNGWNRRKCKQINGKPPTSKYRGVCYDIRTEKWISKIRCNGETYFLGRYVNEKDACKVWNTKAIELYGDNAYINVL